MEYLLNMSEISIGVLGENLIKLKYILRFIYKRHENHLGKI